MWVVEKFLTNVYLWQPQHTELLKVCLARSSGNGALNEASAYLTAGLLWKFRWAPSCLGYMLKLKLNSEHTCSHTHAHTHAELNLAAAARMRNPFSHVQNFLAKVFAPKLLMMKMREKRKAKKCGEQLRRVWGGRGRRGQM